jgi:hypothetical protein
VIVPYVLDGAAWNVPVGFEEHTAEGPVMFTV